ncbi:hypothetical protein [Leifsonia sp. NPDC058230]|uniref:hypothetical protein n=1 Tax=Leifsonia sp. NPDC058230 TaxID=3346391 RepID=UPI0036DAB906
MTTTTVERAGTLAIDQRSVGDACRWPRRAAENGRSAPVRRAGNAHVHDWPSANERTQHLMEMLAVAGARRDDLVFVGASAAAVWGLPIVGAWPPAVEALAGARSVTRTGWLAGALARRAVTWHHRSVPDEDLELVGPWMVTSLDRTLSDLARRAPFVTAVAALDHGLKPAVRSTDGDVFCGADREELLDRVRRDEGARGRAKALAAISFADALSGSPGESLSRVQIHRLGFAAPLLQSRVEHDDGDADYPDFEWEGTYGEFDGFAKYSRDECGGGDGPADIVWQERRREDRLRMHGKAVARWTWEDAWNPPRLRSILMTAGVRPVRPAAFSPDAFGEWVVNA